MLTDFNNIWLYCSDRGQFDT